MRVSGLDLHKDSIFASIVGGSGQDLERVFDTTTSSIYELRDWLLSHQVEEVAMESTGIYWHSVESILQERMSTYVVNPHYVRQVPGKKTDQKDANWIGKLLSKQLIPSSYIARGAQRDLRYLTRHRTVLIRQRSGILVQMSNLLDRCNFRLRRVVSNLSGKYSMKVVRAVSRGQDDPGKLVNLLHGRTLKKHGTVYLTKVLEGQINDHDRFILTQLLIQFDLYYQQVKQVELRMKQLAHQYDQQALDILMSIPGIGWLSAIHLLAEIGSDMSHFKSPKHLSSWAGLCPRNDQSAGKVKSRKIKPGNRYLRVILVQCALAAIRAKNSHFTNVFARLASRMNNKKAVIAIARKQLELVYILLERKEKYRFQ